MKNFTEKKYAYIYRLNTKLRLTMNAMLKWFWTIFSLGAPEKWLIPLLLALGLVKLWWRRSLRTIGLGSWFSYCASEINYCVTNCNGFIKHGQIFARVRFAFWKINRTKFTLRCHYYAIASASVKKRLSKVISWSRETLHGNIIWNTSPGVTFRSRKVWKHFSQSA